MISMGMYQPFLNKKFVTAVFSPPQEIEQKTGKQKAKRVLRSENEIGSELRTNQLLFPPKREFFHSQQKTTTP